MIILIPKFKRYLPQSMGQKITQNPNLLIQRKLNSNYKMADLNYEFEDLGHGRDDGFNAPPGSNFLEDPRQSLAREAIQNILDAKDENVEGPAIAKFELLKIKAKEIPNPDQLKSIFQACQEYYRDPNVKKFYGDAIDKITKNEFIKILKISDYNTQGLSGDPNDPKYLESNFYCFAKTEGSTNKGETSGGSWGLGKASFYNLSGFRTLFYSSIFDTDKYVFGGLLDLNTHIFNDKKKQGSGSFGLKNQEPVRTKNQIPYMFRRLDEKQGTDIYVVDFDDSGFWKKLMTTKILYNFWKAIQDGLLEVQIEDIIVNKDNLGKSLTGIFDTYKPDTKTRPNPFPYLWAYTEHKEKPYMKKTTILGDLKMYYSFNNDFQNKIQFVRNNGMVVMNKVFAFPQKFAAVFVCESREGNIILRKMENAPHNDWKASYVKPGESDQVKRMAEAAEVELRDFVSDFMGEIGKTISVEESEIPEMEDMLGIENPDEFAGFDTSMENSGFGEPTDEETALRATGDIHEIEKLERRTVVTIPVSTMGVKGKNGVLIREGGHGHGHGYGGNENHSGEEVVLKNADFRSFATKSKNGEWKYNINLDLQEYKKLDLILGWGTESGIDYNSPIISGAEEISGKSLITNGNIIHNIVTDNEGKVKLIVYFESNEKYSLGLKAKYENID